MGVCKSTWHRVGGGCAGGAGGGGITRVDAGYGLAVDLPTGPNLVVGAMPADDTIMASDDGLRATFAPMLFLPADDGLTDFVVSSNTTLANNVYYHDYEIPSAYSVKTANYIPFCSGTATIDGVLHNDGVDASGSTAGTATAAGAHGPATSAGGAAGTGAGSSAGSVSNSLGGSGGNGGTGSGGSGGLGGVASAPPANRGGVNIALLPLHRLLGVSAFAGGTTGVAFGYGGGGGGGGGDGGLGGAGGAGAGRAAIVARYLQGVGVIRANGGRGGNAPGGTGRGGGGGGGAGSAEAYAGRHLTQVTLEALGGAGGNGSGTGTNGAPGAAGRTFRGRV